MDKHYLLFDLDGTLTDPKLGITRSVRHSLLSFGIAVPDPDSLLPFIGPPLRDSYKKYCGFTDAQAEKAVAAYREYFADRGIFENAIFDGVDGMLASLRRQGKILAVATSKPVVYAEKILRHFAVDHHFAFVAGSELDGRRSRKVEVIRHALAALGDADPRDAVMVGDREQDVFGAKEAGMDSIGVLYGYGSRQELAAAGATFLVPDVPSLETLLGGE